MPCFGIVFQCTSDHVTHSAPSRETSVSTLTQPHKTAYPPPPPTPLIWLCRPVLAIPDAGIIVYHITEKCFTVATALCVCVCLCVSECRIAYSDLWSDLHFSPPTPPVSLSHVLFSWFINNCEIRQHHFCYVYNLFIHCHFKVFSMIFAVPACLLLLLVVVFYFICLHIVYPV